MSVLDTSTQSTRQSNTALSTPFFFPFIRLFLVSFILHTHPDIQYVTPGNYKPYPVYPTSLGFLSVSSQKKRRNRDKDKGALVSHTPDLVTLLTACFPVGLSQRTRSKKPMVNDMLHKTCQAYEANIYPVSKGVGYSDVRELQKNKLLGHEVNGREEKKSQDQSTRAGCHPSKVLCSGKVQISRLKQEGESMTQDRCQDK